jgi:hypothetical protein
VNTSTSKLQNRLPVFRRLASVQVQMTSSCLEKLLSAHIKACLTQKSSYVKHKMHRKFEGILVKHQAFDIRRIPNKDKRLQFQKQQNISFQLLVQVFSFLVCLLKNFSHM